MDSDSESYDSGFELDPGDIDPSRDNDISPKEVERLKLSKTQDRQRWIVRLQFKQNGEDREGNGFYVNIPHPTHHIILTAGHNLVGVKKEDLKIYQASKKTSPDPAEFYVSTVYQKKYTDERRNPKKATQEQEEADFGAILVKKNFKYPYLGFGFALKLGFDVLDQARFDLTGYKDADDNTGGDDNNDDDENQAPGQSQKEKPKWDAVTSEGKCTACLPNQLEYEMETEKGFSGAPVIMPHKDHDTAVAIHNYGPSNGRKSRGTRINEKLLDEVYGWLQIGFYDKALQASMTSLGPLQERLYLVFTPDSNRAVVRLGYDQEIVTKFDILPAYAPPSNHGFPNDFRYVFRLKPAKGKVPEKRWVLWNAARQTVSLTSSLRDFCFVSLLEDKARRSVELERGRDEKIYYVHVEMKNGQGESTELKELRMRAADLTESDIVLDSLETSEVFFERHKRGKFLFGKIPCMPTVLYKPAIQWEEFDFNLFRFYSG
ncbi:hypothetical protein M431DRAFT_503558 [Trichoderma harzianum CBS 226.95]|uniref:Serine protease n=1 Tax=Trichoderma harzianum CBS 226.95 TaxID=983964 RepID=A0A2T4ANF8_TRIHA|nr:hypothetical protein M431DRAFT_503558 [Trichoderma harzianum CBS 226.95]PTB58599.1 hypothetical protein M431DRAFT_503558 [Trichoderma harzianum CBS 226.95]